MGFAVAIALFVTLLINLAPAAPPPSRRTAIHRDHNKKLIPKTFAGKRRTCTVGETYDSDLGLCGPAMFAPLAFDASLMAVPAVPACDSFYNSMCGTWIAHHTNENRAFSYAYHRNQARIRKIIESGSSVPLNDFYKSCLIAGTPKNVKESTLEYKHTLEVVMGDMRTHADLPTVFGRLGRLGYTAPFVLSFERDPVNPVELPFITMDSFPSNLDEARMYFILNAARITTGHTIVDIQQRIQGVLRIMHEQRMHNQGDELTSITNYTHYVATRLPHDLVRFDALLQEWNVRTSSGGMRGWHNYFQALDGHAIRFAPNQTVWVLGRSYMSWLLQQGIASFDLADWRAFVEFSIIYNGHIFEPDLPSDVYFKQHASRGPLGPGGRLYHRLPRATPPAIPERVEDKCLRITQHMMPGLVAKEFLTSHFPDREQVRADVYGIVKNVLSSLKGLVQQTPWLSQANKDILVGKLNSTIIRVAEPDEWTEEPFAPQITADRYDHNMNMVRRYRVQQNLKLWHKDTPDAFDRSAIAYFAMPLSHVNAYFSPATNTITILAGLLHPPFYSAAYNTISKYAILGSIIGHEMSHALDSNGMYWDRNGSLRLRGVLDSPTEDMGRFFDTTDCVVREYGDTPAGCEAGDVPYGNSTLGEDMADLVGITSGYWAYFNYTEEGKRNALADKQHFFMVLTQAFCENFNQEHVCEAVKEDVHAIAEFRIDRSFRNIPQFQAAFGCHTGQRMYQAQEEMCKIYG